MSRTKPSPEGRPTDLHTDNPLHLLIRTFGQLERVMQPYFNRFGISGSQWGVLRALLRAEAASQPGLRLTDLSERLLVRPPSVTTLVDRLERRGLVARQSVDGDLRARQVVLTDQGRQLVKKVLSGHSQQIATVLGGLTLAEQDQLLRLLRSLSGHLDQLLEHGSDGV